jgi:hypothetical protein
MEKRRQWRRAFVAALLAFGLLQSRSYAFVESTETDGELPSNISGVWLLVSHIEFPKPTPTPAEGTSPVPTPAQSPGAEADSGMRYFNVVNLVRVVHFLKYDANAMRAADRKMEESSEERAKAILAKESKAVPVETATGEVEGGPTVVVPSVPPRRQPGTGDDLDIFLLDVAFPKDMQAEIDKAQKAEKRWMPTAKDLAQLKNWSALKPSGRDEYSKIEWKVLSADKYDDNFQIDPATKDSKFAISGNEDMIPKPNVPKTNIIVYGFDDIKATVMTGKHTRAMMATAPFPLPIEMHGTFKMYKVADLPKVAPGKPASEGKKKGGTK